MTLARDLAWQNLELVHRSSVSHQFARYALRLNYGLLPQDVVHQAKRCVLENSNAPQLPSMSESDSADAEGFLAEMLLCFPLLGVSVFSVGTVAPRAGQELLLKGRGAQARGAETPQGFVVRTGSLASATSVPSCHGYVVELRAALLKNGVLKQVKGGLEFSQDYLFSAPSTAAAVVLGRTSNGRVEWKTKDGRTLKELQELTSA